MAIKSFFQKLTNFFQKIFAKIADLFVRIFTSKFFKGIGSFFKSIPTTLTFIPLFLKKISSYPPLSWFKNLTAPLWRFLYKYLSTALNFIIDLLGKLHLGKIKNAVESLQIFFQPECITGLSFNKNYISAVRVANSFKGIVIDHTAIMPVKNSEKMNWELIEFARKEDLEDTILHTCLPSSMATIRQIPIPIENVRKLNKIIKYQMEPYVPFPIDNMVIDFLPAGSGNKVLTAGVESGILSEHIDNLAQAGLEPQAVSLDDIALINLFHSAARPDTDQPVAVIHFTDDKTTVMILKDSRLLFIRVLAPNKENFNTIKETFNLYTLENPEDTIEQILITGYPDVNEKLAKNITSTLGLPASVWKPFDQFNHRHGRMDPDTQAQLIVPLGLALRGSNSKGKTFDLRKETFAVKSLITLKKFFLYAAYAALIFLILFTMSTYQKLYVLNREYAQLQEDMKRLYVQAFPGAKPVKGTELKQMEQKVNEEAKYKVLDSLGNDNTVLSGLTLLTQTFSQFQDIIIYQLAIEGYEIKLHGSAQSFETVDRLKKALESNTNFQTVKLLDAKKNKRDKTVRFNFSLEKSQ